KHAGGGRCAQDALGTIVAGQGITGKANGTDLFEDVVACPPVQEISRGYFVFGGLIEGAAAFGDGYESIGLGIGKWAEENGVDNTEDGGVGADAKGQSEDGDCGEGGIFAKEAEGEAGVVDEGF